VEDFVPLEPRVMELVEVWIKEKGKVFDYFDELRRAPPGRRLA